MKHVLTFFLAILVSLSFCSCGKDAQKNATVFLPEEGHAAFWIGERCYDGVLRIFSGEAEFQYKMPNSVLDTLKESYVNEESLSHYREIQWNFKEISTPFSFLMERLFSLQNFSLSENGEKTAVKEESDEYLIEIENTPCTVEIQRKSGSLISFQTEYRALSLRLEIKNG